MPDDVEITAGSGTVIKTDLVGGAHYQVVKLDIGGDGVSAPVTDLATSAKQDTGNGLLATLAGAVDGTELQVDVVSSALPSGAATAALQTAGNTLLGGGVASLVALVVVGVGKALGWW